MSFTSFITNSPSASVAQPRAASSTNSATSAGGANTASSSGGAESIGGTFLSLLVKELQNQDPTAPMDSTAMVGQMISLNQLNQLTSINQVLNTAYGVTMGTASSSPAATTTGAQANASSAEAALRLLNSGSAIT